MESSNFPGDGALKHEAFLETAKKITGKDASKDQEIERLRTQYESVMREYREALLLNREIAEELLDSADELMNQISKIDPEFDWLNEDTPENVEARRLNKKAFKKPMN